MSDVPAGREQEEDPMATRTSAGSGGQTRQIRRVRKASAPPHPDDSMPRDLRKAALEWARRGAHVFPCQVRSKKPACRWRKEATNRAEEVAALWTRSGGGDNNIGIDCGKTGWVVIDIDGPPGEGSWRALLTEFGDLPPTREHATGRDGGGRQLVFLAPAGVEITVGTGLRPGIDWRGAGGYIVAPPSVHPTGRPYTITCDIDPAPLPDWLGDLLEKGAPPVATKHRLGRHARASGRLDRRFEALIANLRSATSGRRNDALNRAAYAAGCLSHLGLEKDEASSKLARVAREIGLEQGEIVPTIESGWRAGVDAGPPEEDPGDGHEDLPSISELRMAEALIDREGDNYRYVANQSYWLRWCDSRWVRDERRRIWTAAKTVVVSEALSQESPAARTRATRTDVVGAVLRAAQNDQRVVVVSEELDSDDWFLATPGGTVDLRSGDLRPPRRQDLITRSTAVAPQQCEARLWRRCLYEWTGGDLDLMSYLQRVAGYCLTGSTREHAFFFFYGTGSNGKTTFVETLSAAMGDYARTSSMRVFSQRQREGHPTEIADLAGPRLVKASESESGGAWNEQRIKQLTGGDQITAYRMRCDPFTFTPKFKLIAFGNHKPSLSRVDEAMRRRMHLVPWRFQVPRDRIDQDLKGRLHAELPAILSWAIDGCSKWQERGLDPPRAVTEATEEYFSAQDVVGGWLAEHWEIDPSHHDWFVPIELLYDSYEEECRDQGGALLSKRGLVEELVDRHGLHRDPSPVRGKKGLRGIRTRRGEGTADATPAPPGARPSWSELGRVAGPSRSWRPIRGVRRANR